MDIFR